ncbi:DUF6660 family protein [Chondrinema litorale]|uniref:DUF6660 family protein n=1 Tax=Chondrinema litorale TaxID=2994555 RepID=UPI002543501F|nr:DUF6660 family protein [Chondrinema litorale]UZR97479.1 hypothetical protein OQ292_27110 [Chondrinema litorale]
MKQLACLLAFWFLALSTFPCSDEEEETAVQKEVAISSTQNASTFNQEVLRKCADEQHADHNHSGDNCSPFCQCHCCHTHVTLHKAPFFEVVAFEYFIDYDIRNSNFIPDPHLNSPFHPPKA